MDFFLWALTSGHQATESMHYVTIPEPAVQDIEQRWRGR